MTAQGPELRALADTLWAAGEKSSKGPWDAGWDGVEGCAFLTGPRVPPLGMQSPHGVSFWNQEDARLVSLLRNNLPTIISALERAGARSVDARAFGDPYRGVL